MKQEGSKKVASLKTLTKTNVWDIQESDVFRIWESSEKDVDIRENARHYLEIVKSAFLVEEITKDITNAKSDYEHRGYRVAQVRIGDGQRVTWAIKKRPIMRVSDLTYENINHISASKLVEVLGRNFGGGWESLSQSVQDIIESGFDVSTTTLPANRLHKPGGMYEKKVADGYEVLEVPKGTWVEAIFVKVKPQVEKLHLQLPPSSDDDIVDDYDEKEEEEEETPAMSAGYNDEEMNEENYRTTFDIAGDDEEQGEEMTDYDEENN